jgi:hypothetical protein
MASIAFMSSQEIGDEVGRHEREYERFIRDSCSNLQLDNREPQYRTR